MDNWKKPLSGAKITIANSSFTATTDDEGMFSIEYVPGDIALEIVADGYTIQSVSLNLQQAAMYPLDDTALFKIPPPGGMYLLGLNDYIPLVETSISKQEYRAGDYNHTDLSISTIVERESSASSLEIRNLAEALNNNDFFYVIDSFIHPSGVDVSLVEVNGTGTLAMMTSGATLGTLGESDSFSMTVSENVDQIHNTFSLHQINIAPAQLLSTRAICYVDTYDSFRSENIIDSSGKAYCLFGNESVRDKEIREKTNQLIRAGFDAQNQISEYGVAYSKLPTAAEITIDPVTTEYARSVTWNGTSIIITGNSDALGVTGTDVIVTLTPLSNSGVIWSCSISGSEYVPNSCDVSP